MSKRYPEAVQVQVMKALIAGDSPSELAAKTGISESTMGNWKRRANAARVVPDVAEVAKREVLSLVNEGRLAYLEHASRPEIVQKESGYYSTMAAKNLNEIYQLLTGGPTARVDLATFLSRALEPEAG